ncbi:MAG TPA: hypothetical protein ENK52_05780 [Saprospiraceae bacterium]|nr:hypothetical protein [Saprospiraceae bacterium]
MNFDKEDKLEIFENAISWIVVFGMFIYGGAKAIQFKGAAEIDIAVSDLTGMQLMWAFYGYSQSFALIIGALEITGGILILIKRTRIIGCLFLSAILVNIIMQDIFFDINRGALKAAMIYQTLLLIILWLNRAKLIQAIKILITPKQSTKPKQSKQKIFAKLLLAYLMFVILRIGEYLFTIKW